MRLEIDIKKVFRFLKNRAMDEKKVKINWTEYWLNSSNEWLLEILPTKRWNPQTKTSEDVHYLPIGRVYELLNGLFYARSYTEDELVTWKEYKVEKKKRKDGKSEVYTDDVEIRKLKGTLIIYRLPGESSIHQAIREWVSSTNIVTNDDSLNWFDSKLSARVLKTLCKRLGKVFHVGAEDEADETDKKDLNESLTTEIKVIEKEVAGWWPTTFPEIDKAFAEEIKKIPAGKWNKDDVLIILKKIKKDFKIKSDTPEHKHIKKMLEEYETFFNKIQEENKIENIVKTLPANTTEPWQK